MPFGEKELRRMFVLSSLFHFLFLFLLGIWGSSPSPPRRFDLPSYYFVELVGSFEEPREKKALFLERGIKTNGKRPEAKPLSKKEAEGILPQKEVSFLKEKKAYSEMERAISKIRERVSASELNRAIARMREGILGSQGKEIPAGIIPTQQSTTDLRLAFYYILIWERIKAEWVFPQALIHESGLETIIALGIRQDGEIVKISFEKKSGNSYLDESALRAIKKANPLPPLPEGLQERYLEVGVRFNPQG